MKLLAAGRPHLTYCTNIHPGETWAQVLENLRRYVLRVKRQISPDQPFGVGLRLSAQAAQELSAPNVLQSFQGFLQDHGMYVFTLNGFPYGAFHGTRVKEQVYLPDWLDPRRKDYTDLLATLLAQLLPKDPTLEGSVSTLPGAFKPRVTSELHWAQIAEHLLQHAATLHQLLERTGRQISLALEPEPCCMLETVAETVSFFTEQLYSKAAVQRLMALTGMGFEASERFLHHHLGVCFDACHLSVEFEDMRGSLEALRAAGIRVVKFQLSAGLKRSFDRDVDAVLEGLRPFADPVYLHQVVERRGGLLTRFVDLDDAFAAASIGGPREWRVHFHLPLFHERYAHFDSTQDDVRSLLKILRTEPWSPHLEVETYTWDVLPEALRKEDIVTSVARELRWVLDRLEE